MTEPERVKHIIQILSKEFVCVVEDIENKKRIIGKHPTGKTLFIDALIRPINGDGWKNGTNTIFGIEFKKDHTKGSDVLKHIAQSIDYANSSWSYNGKDFGRIPILISPQFTLTNSKYQDLYYFISRLLGHFNIGEIVEEFKYNHMTRQNDYTISIRMSDTPYWHQFRGVSLNSKNRNFDLKVGSR